MHIQNSTVLLTGATGFLGAHLSRMLQKKVNKLIILKRRNSNTSRISDILSSKNVIFMDIEDGLDKVFQNNKIDIIIHCAVEYGRDELSCLSVLSTNLVFPISIIEMAIKYNVKAFINTDSYFNKPTFSYKHLPNYSLSKKSFLLWLEHFSAKIKTINITLEHIYGEKDNFDKFVENSIQKIAVNKLDSYEATNGEQKRDFIYVSDVVNAYEIIVTKSLVSKARHTDYNLGTGNATSVRDFLLLIKKVSNSPTSIMFGAKNYREDEIMLSIADNTCLQDLGWSPEISVEAGLSKIVTYYKNNQINQF